MANKTFYLDRETDPLNPSLEVANKDELIKVYDDTADMDSDIANIEDDEIVSCKGNDYEGVHITDAVSNGDLNPVTSNAVYQAINNLTQYNPNYVLGEIDTGATWIDGKHIYRRVIHDTLTNPAVLGDRRTFVKEYSYYADNIINVGGYVTIASATAWINGIKLPVNACGLGSSLSDRLVITLDNVSSATTTPTQGVTRLLLYWYDGSAYPTSIETYIVIEYTKTE